MIRRAKIALLVLSPFVLLVVGLIGGFSVGEWYSSDSWREESRAFEKELLARGGWPLLVWHSPSLEWFLFFEQSQYRERLSAFDAVLEQGKDRGDPPISRTLYHTYRMLINTRLSQLDALAGDQDRAEGHMALAVENCAMMGWKDCTPETLLIVADELAGATWQLQMRRLEEGGVVMTWPG